MNIRKSVDASNLIRADGFRWRGGDVSRVEGFSDAVFAFSITLLVVSLEVPTSFNDMFNTLRSFVTFAICFAMLVFIWYHHYTFFRRYGLQDPITITLNAILLFVILGYIYPLKFLFTFLTQPLLGVSVGEPITILPADMPMLMIIYSVGLFAIFGLFILMNFHAYHLRDSLYLNEIEILHTKITIQAHIIYAGISIISILMAAIGGISWTPVAGMIYGLFGPARYFHGRWYAKKFIEINNSAEKAEGQ